MNYFDLDPEVAGGLGENTVIDNSVHPPVIHRLHYVFDGWLGDVILTTFPCFIVTQQAQQELLAIKSTGVTFDKVEVTTSEEFHELFPDICLPKFVWLKVDGIAGVDDFGLLNDGAFRLIVSGKALEVLKKLGLSNAIVEPFRV